MKKLRKKYQGVYPLMLILISVLLISTLALIKTKLTPEASVGNIVLDLTYGIIQSGIASIVFYHFVVYLPERKRKSDLGNYIKLRCLNIAGDAEGLFQEMSRAVGLELKFETTTEIEVEKICKKLHMFERAPMVMGAQQPFKFANWLYYMYDKRARTLGFIEDVFLYMLFLESEHIKKITEIKSCSYLKIIEMTYLQFRQPLEQPENPGQTFSHISKLIYDYFTYARNLRLFIEQEFD